MNYFYVPVVLSTKKTMKEYRSDPVVAKEWLEVPYDGSQTIQDLVEDIKRTFKISREVTVFTKNGHRMHNGLNLRILYQIKKNETIIVLLGPPQTTNMGRQTEETSVSDSKTEMKNKEAKNMDGGNEDIDQVHTEMDSNNDNAKDVGKDNDSGMPESGEDGEVPVSEVKDANVEPRNKRKVRFSEDCNKVSPSKKLRLNLAASTPEPRRREILPSPILKEGSSTPSGFEFSVDSFSNNAFIESFQASPNDRNRKYSPDSGSSFCDWI